VIAAGDRKHVEKLMVLLDLQLELLEGLPDPFLLRRSEHLGFFCLSCRHAHLRGGSGRLHFRRWRKVKRRVGFPIGETLVEQWIPVKRSAGRGGGRARHFLLDLDERLRGRLTGRPRDFGSRYLGSSPSPGARFDFAFPFPTPPRGARQRVCGASENASENPRFHPRSEQRERIASVAAG
jgi:hypothetical protein